MNKGLAIVIIGGLLSSLFLTLIVVPLVYLIFDNIGKRFGKGVKTDYEKLMIADYEHKDIKGEHDIISQLADKQMSQLVILTFTNWLI